MPSRFYRRRWNESRGDEFYAWGPAVYLFQVGEDGFAVRQIEVYDAGPVLRYGPGHLEDRYGFLTSVRLTGDGEDWSPYAIAGEEFERFWAG